MRVAAIALVACLGLATSADAMQRRAGALAGNGGARADNLNDARERARENRLENQLDAAARQENQRKRSEEFAATVKEREAAVQAIRDKAASEMRPLTPQEESTIATIERRITAMKQAREQAVAQGQERAAEIRDDVQDRQDRNNTLRRDQRNTAGLPTRPVGSRPLR